MSAHLTYRPREGAVFGMVAGKLIRLATLRRQAGMDVETWRQAVLSSGTVPAHVTDWNKSQEFRVGKWAAAIGNRLTVAENTTPEIYDYPGEYAQRFDGAVEVAEPTARRITGITLASFRSNRRSRPDFPTAGSIFMAHHLAAIRGAS